MDTVLLAERTIKDALKKGCDEAEVFIKTVKRLSAEAKEGRPDAMETAKDFGISLRVIKKHRLGFSFTTDPESIADMIDEALNAAEWTSPDEYLELPQYQKPALDVLISDEGVKNITEEDVIKYALMLEKAAIDYDTRIKKIRKADVVTAVADTTILNSKGINVSYESTHISASAHVFANDGQDSQAGWDSSISRRLEDVDFLSVARNASRKAIDLLGSKKITPVRVPVILDSSVSTDFLGILSASLSAEAVQKKRSFLADKVGEKVISPLINIFDDAIIPWKVGTRPVDDEGVPTSKKMIVSKGALTGFIHNTYTAKKDGVSSTGNAVRGSFKSLPGVDVTNFYIEPDGTYDKKKNPPSPPFTKVGNTPLTPLNIGEEFPPLAKGDVGGFSGEKNNNLIKSVSKGLLVLETMGMHTANPVSGDFSVGISGLWIENGETVYPVKEVVMSGNILDLFMKIEAVGSDLRFYGKIGSPSLLIGGMDISA